MTSPNRVDITVAVRDAGATAALGGIQKAAAGVGTAAETASTTASTAMAKVDTAMQTTGTKMQGLGADMTRANAGMAGPLAKFETSGKLAGDKFSTNMTAGIAKADMAGGVNKAGTAATAAAGTHGARAGKSFGQSMMTGFMAVGIVTMVGKVLSDTVDQYTGMAVDVNAIKRLTGGDTTSSSQLRTSLQLAGLDSTKSTTALKLFSKNLGVAAGDADKTAAMTDKLGFAFTDATGAVMPLTDLMAPLADKFQAMPNGAEKTALAMQLFGKSGTDMLPFLGRGADGLAALSAKSDELGLTLDDTALTAMGNAKVAQREWDASIQATKIALGGALLPVLTELRKFLSAYFIPVLQKVTGFIKENADWLGPLTLGIVELAAAWKILNVVMNTNPIILIATALIALVGTIIWAYQNVDWFREGVDKAWSWIKDAWAKAWVIIEPIMQWLWEAIKKVGDVLVWLWENVVVPVWTNFILPAIQAAWAVYSFIFQAWWAAIQAIGTVIMWLWDNVISPVWNGVIVPAFQWAWDNILQPVWSLFKQAIDKVSDAITWLNDNVIGPIWTNIIGPAINDVWTNIIQPAWTMLQSFVSGMGAFFEGVKNGVIDAAKWIGDKIKEITDAITSFLGLDFSKGGAVDAAKAVTTNMGGGTSGNDPNNPATIQNNTGSSSAYGKAAGGWITGGAGGIDDVPIMATAGEFMVNKNASARYRNTLLAINAGYDLGGLIQAGRDQGYSSLIGWGGPALDAKGAQYTHPASGGAPGGPWNGPSGVEQWRSTALAALAAAGESSMWVDDLLRQMNQESSGNPRAINLTDSNAQAGHPSMGLLQTIISTFTNALQSNGFGVYVPKGPYDPFANILAGILYTRDHYGDLGYWARNGFGAYDTGGIWPSGTGGVNRSGRDEYVMNPDETAAMKAGRLGGRTVTIAAGAIQINGYSAGDAAGIRQALEQALRDILDDDRDRRL